MKNLKLISYHFRKIWFKSVLLIALIAVSTACKEDNIQKSCLETCGVIIEEEFNVIVFSEIPDVSFLVLQLGEKKDTLISGGRPPGETNYIRCWQTSELRPDESMQYKVIYEVDGEEVEWNVGADGIETNKIVIQITEDRVKIQDYVPCQDTVDS